MENISLKIEESGNYIRILSEEIYSKFEKIATKKLMGAKDKQKEKTVGWMVIAFKDM